MERKTINIVRIVSFVYFSSGECAWHIGAAN